MSDIRFKETQETPMYATGYLARKTRPVGGSPQQFNPEAEYNYTNPQRVSAAERNNLSR